MGIESNERDRASEIKRSREIFEKAHTALDANETARLLEHFDRDWEVPERYDAGMNEEYAVYDIKPLEQRSEIPVTVVPGWGANPEMFKEHMRTLVGEGFRAIAADATHGIEHDLPDEDRIGKIAEAELRRIAAFMHALDQKGIEKTDAIGHSEGGLDVLLAASMFPERFDTVVLVNPAGMIADDDALRLTLRFSYDAVRSWAFAIRQHTVPQKMEQDRHFMPLVVKNPLHSTKEVLSISRSTIYDRLREVKEKGVKVIIIHSPQDVVFPMHKVGMAIQDMKETPKEDIQNLLDGFYSVGGDHNTFIRRAPEYTHLAASALRAAHAQRETRV